MCDTNSEYKKALTIADPPQYGVILEEYGQMDKSIFESIYRDAAKNVADIISFNSESQEKMPNTVIAFVGRRGSGKSTAMYSFSEFLTNGYVSEIVNDEKDKKHLEKSKFYTLDTIDSAQLGVKETVIGRISASMYKGYSDEIKSTGCAISAEKKRDFIRKITEVNKYAVMYQTGEWFKRGESLLDDTYQISMLRNNMGDLVQSYLKFISKKDELKNDYLVISIDDLDMGIENSYTVMEEIRKFLCIKNTIVLITLRMDQIHLSLKEKFKKQLGTKIDDETDKALIDDLAYRYMEKLFPYDRQHQMPTLSSEQLKNINANFIGTKYILDGERNFITIRDAILSLVWDKTRIILIPNKDDEHLLIPHNLRSLCNFVVFLRGMKDVGDTPDNVNKDVLKNNIEEFSCYLVNNIGTFEYMHISMWDQQLAGVLTKIIHNMESIPLKIINSCIVGDILYYLQQSNNEGKGNCYYNIFNWYRNGKGKIVYRNSEEKSELSILLDSCMQPECISLGDLMYVLGKIDSKTRCRYIKYLVEVIRTLWSAKMTNEYYKEKSKEESKEESNDKNNKTNQNGEIEGNGRIEGGDGKDKRNNNLNSGSDYKRAIGSLIVNPDIGFWNENVTDFEYFANGLNSPYYVYGINLSSIESQNQSHKSYDYECWRKKWAKPKYTSESGIWCHPFKLFTSDELIGDIPLYSFDFVYCFYEKLHENAKEKRSFLSKVLCFVDCPNVIDNVPTNVGYHELVHKALKNVSGNYKKNIQLNNIRDIENIDQLKNELSCIINDATDNRLRSSIMTILESINESTSDSSQSSEKKINGETLFKNAKDKLKKALEEYITIDKEK